MRRILLAFIATILVALPAAVPARASIVINEIMYDSNYSPDIEYVELYNTGPTAQNLGDWYMLDSVNYPSHAKCFLVGTLGVGQYIVIAADTALFRARYPGVTNLNIKPFDQAGTGFGLGNSSDQVRIYDDNDVIRDSVAYSSSGNWPSGAAGSGPSAELVNPFLDNSVGTNWLASTVTGGTPGTANSVFAANAAPVCDNGERSVDLPRATDAVTVTVRALDPENHLTSVVLYVDSGAGYVSQPMYDDGLHGDGAATDSVFGSVIAAMANGTLVKYYAIATDILGQTNTYPDGAPATDYKAYTVGYVAPVLVVNEVVAENTAGAFDDNGEREDWLELYNPGAAAVSLAGMCLTDNLDNGNKWEIPAGISIAAGGYLVFWADDNTLQGPMHATFKFSNDGEEAGIFTARDNGGVKIDGWKFGPVAANVSVGYKPDYAGTDHAGVFHAPDYLETPTPGASNASSAYYSPVCINEFQTTSRAGGVDDWIELYNRGASAYDLSGAYLSDNRSTNTKFKFPAGTTIAAGQFLVFDEATVGFSMSSSGEVIMLTAADSVSGMDFHDFAQQRPDTSEGRVPDGTGRWAKFATETRGASNSGALAVGPGALATAALSGVRIAPNPFTSGTEIRFTLGHSDLVTAAVYDPSGRRVRTLHRGVMAAGNNTLHWNGENERGAKVSAGMYFVRVATTTSERSYSMLLLK